MLEDSRVALLVRRGKSNAVIVAPDHAILGSKLKFGRWSKTIMWPMQTRLHNLRRISANYTLCGRRYAESCVDRSPVWHGARETLPGPTRPYREQGAAGKETSCYCWFTRLQSARSGPSWASVGTPSPKWHRLARLSVCSLIIPMVDFDANPLYGTSASPTWNIYNSHPSCEWRCVSLSHRNRKFRMLMLGIVSCK